MAIRIKRFRCLSAPFQTAGLVTAIVCLASLAHAHKLRPAIVNATLQEDGGYRFVIQTNMEAILAGIGPQHQDTANAPQARTYDTLRKLPPAELEVRIREFGARFLEGVTLTVDGVRTEPKLDLVRVPEVGDVATDRVSTLTLTGMLPAGSSTLTWRYSADYGDNVLRITREHDAEVRSQWLAAGEESHVFSLNAETAALSRGEVAWRYLLLGYTHIVPKGLDHILFVLGIFLLSRRWGPLLWQVTAFTLAHSITLALSMYGVFSLSPRIVEPLIALSIVYVALENVFTRELKPWRVIVVFCFGLLHGMGFAGVLTELGLPRGEFVTALITFNLGVEGGQLSVIALAFAMVGLFRQRDWYRQRIVVPASLAISAVGLYWTVERVLG
jgi:hydrogenase/urease accessory protein HupE